MKIYQIEMTKKEHKMLVRFVENMAGDQFLAASRANTGFSSKRNVKNLRQQADDLVGLGSRVLNAKVV